MAECCFADCTYNPRTSFCLTHLCPKESILSSSCSIVADVCTGKEGEREFINAWTLSTEQGMPPCVYYLSRRLLKDTPPLAYDISTASPPPGLFRSSTTLLSARLFLDEVFSGYAKYGYKIGSPPNSSTFSPVEYTLYSVCKNVPGLCSSILPSLCSSYSGEDLLRVPSLANWCGCYLRDEEYARYVNLYHVTKECTPYCSRSESIPLSTPSATEISPCQQNVCILDDVSIELVNSTITNGIRFTQICGNCGERGRCSCISTDTNLAIVGSRVEGIDFLQECGESSKCTKRIGTLVVEVPCELEDISSEIEEQIEKARKRKNAFVFFLILGAILFVGLVWWILSLFSR